MKLNREVFAKKMKEQASHRSMEITDEQITNIANEAEQAVDTAIAFMTNIPLEQKLLAMFSTGALFGLDGCDPKTETLVVNSKKEGGWEVGARIPDKD